MEISRTLRCLAVCLVVQSVFAMRKEGRVVGGKKVVLGQFPFVVLVQRGDYECTGSLISAEWVLTAGHCTERRDPLLYWVTAGIVNKFHTGPTAQVRDGKELVQHPKFLHVREGDLDYALYDIALIKVDRPFKFNQFVNKVGLSAARPPFPAAWTCIGIGFGNTKVQASEMQVLMPPKSSPHGRTVSVSEDLLGLMSIVLSSSPESCRDFGDPRWREPYQLCSYGGEVNVTHLYLGDSGGPLVCGGVEVGLSSMLEGKWHQGRHFIVQVHTATHFFMCWIRQFVPEAEFDYPCWRGDDEENGGPGVSILPKI